MAGSTHHPVHMSLSAFGGPYGDYQHKALIAGPPMSLTLSQQRRKRRILFSQLQVCDRAYIATSGDTDRFMVT
jgi:hypothetical protein